MRSFSISKRLLNLNLSQTFQREAFFDAWKAVKSVFGRESAPDPAVGAHGAPPDPLVGWEGETSSPFHTPSTLSTPRPPYLTQPSPPSAIPSGSTPDACSASVIDFYMDLS